LDDRLGRRPGLCRSWTRALRARITDINGGRPHTAQFWLEHGRKYHAKKITQEEALARLEEGHSRGNITTAWFKVATGGRTGVRCSCCTCCCGGLYGMRVGKRLKGGEDLEMIIPSGPGKGYPLDIDFVLEELGTEGG